MKPMIETTIFNTKEDGKGQVIANMLAYEADMEPWHPLDSHIITTITDMLQEQEEEGYSHQYEIKIFSGDIEQVKKPSTPKTLYLQGPSIVLICKYIPGTR